MTQTDLSRVLEKITEIVEKSADDDYIYRGEQEHYDKVSSNLYREAPHTDRIRFNIKYAQRIILEEARGYIGETSNINDETFNLEILTELQHFGGKTNLIDFTKDYLIALFFACDGSDEKEGRIIFFKNDPKDPKIKEPPRTSSRVESQKSVFVESPEGFVEVDPDAVVTIPVDMKQPMLKYLEKYHRISVETIYNDLHGFIRRSAYVEFIKGLRSQGEAIEAETHEKEYEHNEKAIRHYTEALRLERNFNSVYNNRAIVYNNRAVAYIHTGEFGKAIEDCNEAIKLDSKDAAPYYNLGEAWLHLGEWEKARANFNTAKEKGIDLGTSFRNDYESVAAFEAEHDVKVPEDIAALLSP